MGRVLAVIIWLITLLSVALFFNDKWWFDRRGTPHTEQLHVIERYTRLNYGQIRNNATIEDPGALEQVRAALQ